MQRARKRLTGRIPRSFSAPLAVARGLWTAFCTPLWLEGPRLQDLLRGTVEEYRSSGRGELRRSDHLEAANRAASAALRLLSRLPGSPWRNTCLYRSVSECLLRRRYGLPARLVLGVRRSAPGDSVEAHAWVAVRDSPSHRTESWNLLRDGSLLLTAEPEVRTHAEPWLPRYREPGPAGAPESSAMILVRATGQRTSPRHRPGEGPDLRVGSAEARLDADGEGVHLWGSAAGVRGEVDLRCRRAEVRVPVSAQGSEGAFSTLEPGSAPSPPALSGDPAIAPRESTTGLAGGDRAWEVFSVLTLASALLLGRIGRTLVHAAAVVRTDGGAWLLAGDARSGKSSACAALIGAGWNWLADDQVVLESREGELWAEGWPRAFHLDTGWWADGPIGRRREVSPEALGPGEWQAEAPVNGVLLPEIRPDKSTELIPAPASEALSRLVRQSPWLLSDQAVAEEILDMLVQAAHAPSFHLVLGREAFGDPDPILGAMRRADLPC